VILDRRVWTLENFKTREVEVLFVKRRVRRQEKRRESA
jgi:hypothetical protein